MRAAKIMFRNTEQFLLVDNNCFLLKMERMMNLVLQEFYCDIRKLIEVYSKKCLA